MDKNHKHELGQFMTTNQNYILQNMYIPKDIKNIIEPFAGNEDLLNGSMIVKKEDYKIECYDIEPKKANILKQDTLNNPPDYNNKFIITNPPYLARNKSKDKPIFDKYKVNDLYKCFIKELITNKSLGGIIIIPLNFWSSIRISDIKLRKLFLEQYDILQLNIFEEKVFEDTTYSVCSFQFQQKKDIKNNTKINITIYPSKKEIQVELNDRNNYIIGGEIYKLLIKNKYKITRLTSKNKDKQNTNILVKCIDDNQKNKICLSYDEKLYIDNTPNQTARTYATLIIEPIIDINKQKELINKFNKFLNDRRNDYNSLFLTNYRESNTIARKRISFDLVYLIVEYILENDFI